MIEITLLGSSGSIGKQTVKVIEDNKDELSLVGVSVYQEDEYLKDLLNKHKSIKYVCIGDKMNYREYVSKYPNVTFYQGDNGLIELASNKVDLVVNALVGFLGLMPIVSAIRAHNDIALANKECLVSAGELLIKEVYKNGVELYPVDSEHNAIYQCLKGEKDHEVRRLIITASGGPFRDRDIKDLDKVSVSEAIHHPNWIMGPKISVDSATLINKGLEIIEAHYLFGFDYDKIDVVMQLESIVHSLVEFNDGSMKAIIGYPSMETPIQYALFKGSHQNKFDANLNLNKPFSLNFRPIDFNRFEAVMLAYKVGRLGLSYPLAFNASNEIAVKDFIDGKIPFTAIVKIVKECINEHEGVKLNTFEDVISVDKQVRALAQKVSLKYQGGK